MPPRNPIAFGIAPGPKVEWQKPIMADGLLVAVDASA
jgi:hypothetical protein